MLDRNHRLLITGSSGFIGRQLVCLFPKFEVFEASLGGPASELRKSVTVNLLNENEIKNLVQDIRPTLLIHLAWEARPGTYWTDPINREWTEKSALLYQEFLRNGGERAVFSGSVAEYEWKSDVYREDETPIKPATLYGQCKAQLFQELSKIDKKKFSWARLFYLYGEHEAPNRLVSGAFAALLKEQPFETTDGTQVRDYLHVSDAAEALKTILLSSVNGAINVASGRPSTVKEILEAIGKLTKRRHLIQFGKLPTRPNDPKEIVADVTKLKSIGWEQNLSLEKGLEQTFRWWLRS